MKKPYSILIFLGLIIVIGIGAFLVFFKNKNNSLLDIANKIIFFYGANCPFCVNVENFMTENKVEEKIQFEKKEVFYDENNANLLLKIVQKCGLPDDKIGVPMLWDGYNSKCIVGDKDIINFFQEKIGG